MQCQTQVQSVLGFTFLKTFVFNVKNKNKNKTGIAATLEIKTLKFDLIIPRGFFAQCLGDDPTALPHQSSIKKAAS